MLYVNLGTFTPDVLPRLTETAIGVISETIAAVLMLPTRTRTTVLIGLHDYFGAVCGELVDAERLLHGGLGLGDRGHPRGGPSRACSRYPDRPDAAPAQPLSDPAGLGRPAAPTHRRVHAVGNIEALLVVTEELKRSARLVSGARAGSDGEPRRTWLATSTVTPEHIQVPHLRRVILVPR